MTHEIKEIKGNAMRMRSLFIFFALILVMYSCGKKHLELPETPILSKSPGWVIVTAKWVRLKEQPAESAREISFLRYKDIAELQKRIYVPEAQGLWCEIRYEADSTNYIGWVKAQDVLVLESKEQALEVLKTME